MKNLLSRVALLALLLPAQAPRKTTALDGDAAGGFKAGDRAQLLLRSFPVDRKLVDLTADLL